MRHALTAFALLLAVLLLEPRPVASAKPEGSGEPSSELAGESPRGFSRARWIEAHERTGVFDGGALPARGPRPTLPKAGSLSDRAAAAIANVQVSRDLLAPDDSLAQGETQAEPFLAIDPLDERRLLAGYQEARFETGGARALAWAVSTNSGRRWKSGLIPNLTEATGGPWQRASDPWVAFGPNHRAYYVSLAFDESRPDNGVVVSTSLDGGVTWGDPVDVHRNGDTDFDDKEAIVVDNTSGPFRGRVYVAWDEVTETRGQPVLISWSEDGGASFSPAVAVAGGVNLGVLPLVAPDGVVHLVWTRFSGPGFSTLELFTARSEDGGATWSEPVRIDQIHPVRVSGMRTGEGLATAAVDRRNGTIYVAWQDVRGNAVNQILLSRSTDGGLGWTPPVLVSDFPGSSSFTPALAVDGTGRVGVAYQSLRNDHTGTLGVDEYLAFSTNGGASFGASRRLSRNTWNAVFAAHSRAFFLGDYQGLAAGRKLFHALFVTTYQPSAVDAERRQPDVFAASMR